MTRRLYLFADTNLFIQCRPLEELDWSPWPEFSEVHLIVSRPVQREIDNQKNRGKDRVGKRSRKAYGLFRKMILSKQDHQLIRQAGPEVKLFLAEAGVPSAAWADRLDYSKPDDEIIGHMCAFMERHPGVDVRLLTHDSGPMMTARSLKLPFVAIPGSWLLEPAASEAEKENRRLREELKQLQNLGPKFRIAFFDDTGEKVERIEGVYRAPTPLSRAEVQELMRSLNEGIPEGNYHGQSSRQEYYQWLAECVDFLEGLHEAMRREAPGVPFRIAAANTGTTPGKDVLIRVAAKGEFRIRPPREESEDDDAEEQPAIALPPPPRSAPPGIGTVFANLGMPGYVPEIDFEAARRDPNGFYYKPDRPDQAVVSYSLECEQWRHGADNEDFHGEILADHAKGEVRGELECTIQAENLPDPARQPVSVHIAVESVSVLELGRALVKHVCQA